MRWVTMDTIPAGNRFGRVDSALELLHQESQKLKMTKPVSATYIKVIGDRQIIAGCIGIFIVAATAAGAPIVMWQALEISLRLMNNPVASNICC